MQWCSDQCAVFSACKVPESSATWSSNRVRGPRALAWDPARAADGQPGAGRWGRGGGKRSSVAGLFVAGHRGRVVVVINYLLKARSRLILKKITESTPRRRRTRRAWPVGCCLPLASGEHPIATYAGRAKTHRQSRSFHSEWERRRRARASRRTARGATRRISRKVHGRANRAEAGGSNANVGGSGPRHQKIHGAIVAATEHPTLWLTASNVDNRLRPDHRARPRLSKAPTRRVRRPVATVRLAQRHATTRLAAWELSVVGVLLLWVRP